MNDGCKLCCYRRIVYKSHTNTIARAWNNVRCQTTLMQKKKQFLKTHTEKSVEFLEQINAQKEATFCE